MTARIAVVVPTFNRAHSLARLLDALAIQERVKGGVEVIIVDDGSTDETAEVVSRHPSVKYLAQSNAGPAAARNRGWRYAGADLVAFTDDDTVPHAGWLSAMVAAFDRQPGLAAAGGAIEPLVPGFLADFVQLEGLVAHGVDHQGSLLYLVTANATYRRCVLEQMGGFDEGFRGASGEDTELTLRMREVGLELAIVSDALVSHDNRTSMRGLLATYHRHGSSRTQVRESAGVGTGGRPNILRLAHWADRVDRYRRAGCSRVRCGAYLALKVIGACAYALGVLRSALTRSRLAAERARGS